MSGMIRVHLVDPLAGTNRSRLESMLRAMDVLDVSEVSKSYQAGAKRATEIPADLTVVVLDGDAEQAVRLVESMLRERPDKTILPAGSINDPAMTGMILRVMRAGAREFLTLPTTPEEVAGVLGRLSYDRGGPSRPVAKGPSIITIAGASGGIGTTTLAANLAVCLATNPPNPVMLIDLDLLFGATDAMLDIIPSFTLLEAMQKIDRMDADMLKHSIAKHDSGVHILPRPKLMEDAAKIDSEELSRLLQIAKEAFPSIVIDAGKGLQATDFAAFESSDVILLVIQLDLICLRNTARLIQLFKQYDGYGGRIKLIANRVGSRESEFTIKKAEEILETPIAWQIPNSTKIFYNARARGIPIALDAATSKPALSFMEIAKECRPYVSRAPEPVKAKRGLFAALF